MQWHGRAAGIDIRSSSSSRQRSLELKQFPIQELGQQQQQPVQDWSILQLSLSVDPVR